VDGLFIGDRPLLPAELTKEEQMIYQADGAWLERVLRVVWENDKLVSVYVAESEFSGGAHANNKFRCRTLDRQTGRALTLHDMFPSSSAELLIAKVNALFDANTAMEVLGHDLETDGSYRITPDGFRLRPVGEVTGGRPEIILCAEGAYPLGSSTLFELPIAALPMKYQSLCERP
jgi:hypothetical protein